MQKAVKSLNRKIEGLGPAFQKALTGNASAIKSFTAKSTDLKGKISELETELDTLGNKRIPTKEYAQLEREFEAASQKADKLLEKWNKLIAAGNKPQSKTMQALQYDIKNAADKSDILREKLESLENSGKAYTMGSDTQEYKRMEQDIANAKAQLDDMSSKVKNSNAYTADLKSNMKGIRQSTNNIGKSLATGLINKLKSGVKHTESLRKKMLKVGFAFLSIRGAWQGLRQIINSALQDNEQLQNQLTAAKGVLGTALAPIIQQLVGLLSSAVTFADRLYQAFTGVSLIAKYNAQQTAKAAKAAKEYRSNLASIDELNILDSNNSDASDNSEQQLFKAAQLKGKALEYLNAIKKALKTGDFSYLGDKLADDLNSVLDKALNIDWDGKRNKINSRIAGFINGINAFITGTNWQNTGALLGEGINTALGAINTAFATFDWEASGVALANFLIGLFKKIDWGKAGETIHNLVTGLCDAISSFFNTLTADSQEGETLRTALTDFIEGLQLDDILISIAKLSVSVLTFGVTFLDDLAESIGIALGSQVADVSEKISKWLNDAIAKPIHDWIFGDGEDSPSWLGKMFSSGIYDGMTDWIVSKFTDLSNWFSENIHLPIAEDAQVHSPSKKMYTLGEFIAEGLYNGIVEWIKKKLKDIVNCGQSLTSSLKDGIGDWSSIGRNITEGIKNGIANGWSKLTSFVKDKALSLFETATKALDIHSPSRLFRDGVGAMITKGLGLGIADEQEYALRNVQKVASAIESEFKNGSYGLSQIEVDSNGSIVNGMNSFSSTIADGFTELMNKLQAIADGVVFKAPAIASGIVPYDIGNGKTPAIFFDENAVENSVYRALKAAMENSSESGAFNITINLTTKLDKKMLAEEVFEVHNDIVKTTNSSPLKIGG